MNSSLKKKYQILVVDDEELITRLMVHTLSNKYIVKTSASSDEALELVKKQKPEIIVTDLKMPGGDGISLLKKIKEHNPEIIVIIMTGYGEKRVAIQALKYGAFDFLEKPLKEEELFASVGRAEEQLRLKDELDRAQAELIASHKMRVVGELSAGIAHEINNPLSVIILRLKHAKLLSEKKPSDWTPIFEFFDIVSTQVDRILKIINGLRKFTRPGEDDPFIKERILNLVQASVDLCEGEKDSDIYVTIEDIPADLAIECRATQIEQVLVNMINNSCDAVSNLEEKWIKIGVINKENFIELILTDSGKGIPKDSREKIFEAFYTTKERGKGTGLGLSIVKSIIDEHGGSLDVDDSSSNTKIVITLPKLQN